MTSIHALGAHHAVDYRRDAVTALGPFDVVLDVVGTDLPAFRRLLVPSGRMISLAMNPDRIVRSMAFIVRGGLARSRKVISFSNNPSAERLTELARYVEAGTLRPAVDTVFPMEAIVEAHQRLEAGGVRGKYVIDILA